MRCNGFRALGIFLKIVKDIPTDGDQTAILFDQGISIIVKQATTGNFMKVTLFFTFIIAIIIESSQHTFFFLESMERLLCSREYISKRQFDDCFFPLDGKFQHSDFYP